MLVGPATHVLAERAVEALGAEHALAQQHETERPLVVLERVHVLGRDGVRTRDDRLCGWVQQVGNDLARRVPALRCILTVALGRELAAIERIGGVDVDERVEALIHEGEAPLVGAHDHGEPVVAHLVVGHRPEPLPPAAPTAEVDPRVLHAAHGAANVHRHLVRILQQLLREVFDRGFRVLGGARVGVRTRTLHRVRGHREHRAAARRVRRGGIPHERLRRGPRHIAAVLHGEMPDQSRLRGGARSGIGHFLRGADVDRAVALPRGGEASALSGGEYLVRVLQHARSHHDVRRGDVDSVVVVAVVEVELAVPHERESIPAANVVVHGHARVPLSDVVYGSVPAVHAARAAVVGSNLEGVLHRHLHAVASGRERAGELEAHARVGDAVPGARASAMLRGGCARDVKAVGVRLRLIRGSGERAARVGTVPILVELQPEVAQSVRTVIDVGDRHLTSDRVPGIIEARGYAVG